jgi:hypothetical protein
MCAQSSLFPGGIAIIAVFSCQSRETSGENKPAAGVKADGRQDYPKGRHARQVQAKQRTCRAPLPYGQVRGSAALRQARYPGHGAEKLATYAPSKVRDIIEENIRSHLLWLEVFGVLLGMLFAGMLYLAMRAMSLPLL